MGASGTRMGGVAAEAVPKLWPGRARAKRGDDTPQRGVIVAAPKALTAWRMLKARIACAASAFTALSPLVRNLPPPDIRLIVPNGWSTVYCRIVRVRLDARLHAAKRALIDKPVDRALGP